MNSNKWGINKEFLEKEYIEKKKSLVELHKETGIPYETLYYYLKIFNLPSHPIGLWHKNRRRSQATEFKKGQTPWNKGKKGIMTAWNKGKKTSAEIRKKVSEATKKAMARPEIQDKVRKTQFKRGMEPWNKGKTEVYSKETVEKIREARLRQKFPKHNTNAELALFQILDRLDVRYRKHHPIKRICQADAFIPPNIAIFADGDYWHCNPKIYDKPKTQAQIKNLKRDYSQNSKLVKDEYTVVRIWASDLLSDPYNCEIMLKEIIGRASR